MRAGRTHQDCGIDQTGRPHHLFDHLSGVLVFIIGRRRRNEYGLPHLAFELIEAQRPVVQRRRQTKTIIDQIGFARAVAVIHAIELAQQHVRLIKEHQRILWQIINQCRWGIARLATAQVARIIFNAFGKADFLHHLQIEARTLLQALFFNQFIFLAEPCEAITQFLLDGIDRAQHRRTWRHIMRAWIDGEAGNLLPHAPSQRIE